LPSPQPLSHGRGTYFLRMNMLSWPMWRLL